MGRSRIRKSSSLSSLVTVLLILDLAGDNGNLPAVCLLVVIFLLTAPCESSSESEKFTGTFIDFKFGLLNFSFDSVDGFLYDDFLLEPGDFLLSLNGLYTLSVLLLPPVFSIASSSIASSIRSIWFTPLGSGIDVLEVYVIIHSTSYAIIEAANTTVFNAVFKYAYSGYTHLVTTLQQSCKTGYHVAVSRLSQPGIKVVTDK